MKKPLSFTPVKKRIELKQELYVSELIHLDSEEIIYPDDTLSKYAIKNSKCIIDILLEKRLSQSLLESQEIFIRTFNYYVLDSDRLVFWDKVVNTRVLHENYRNELDRDTYHVFLCSTIWDYPDDEWDNTQTAFYTSSSLGIDIDSSSI